MRIGDWSSDVCFSDRACYTELNHLIPIILDWWQQLPAHKKHLLVGIQLGVEISIGANNWYYPNGNDLLDEPASEDPRYGLSHDELPGRGAQPIGYAAVSTLEIANKIGRSSCRERVCQ